MTIIVNVLIKSQSTFSRHAVASLSFVCEPYALARLSEKAPASDIFQPQHLAVGCLNIAPI